MQRGTIFFLRIRFPAYPVDEISVFDQVRTQIFKFTCFYKSRVKSDHLGSSGRKQGKIYAEESYSEFHISTDLERIFHESIIEQ
jgi:hypothetical protein